METFNATSFYQLLTTEPDQEKEQSLIRQVEKFETLANSIPIYLTIFNSDGTIDWINKTMMKGLGLAQEEIINNQILNICFPNEEIRSQAQAHMNHSGPTQEWKEFKMFKKDGTWMHTSWTNVRLSSGKNVGIGQDITHLRKNEEVIREQQAKIVAASKMSLLGEMAAGIAHEVNNPLTIISGHAQILKQLAQTNNLHASEVIELAANIQQTVQRISKIVSGLKNFARDGETEPFVKSNIASIISETLAFCEARFRKNAVRLDVVGVKDIQLQCRPVQISQVILNLLSNAYDAVQCRTDKWVKLSVEETATEVVISVTDSGPGIPEHLREKIMEPFFTTKPLGKGTGLGLSLSRGLIEAHDGKLFLDTSKRQTCFTTVLPKKRG